MPKITQRKKRGFLRILIEPSRYELVQPGKESIFDRVRALVSVDDEGVMQIAASEVAVGMCGLTTEIDALIARYNEGHRFI